MAEGYWNNPTAPVELSISNYGGWSNANTTAEQIGNVVICYIYGDNLTGAPVNVFGNGYPNGKTVGNFPLAHYRAGGAGINTIWGYLANGKLNLRTPIPNGDSLFGIIVYTVN